MILTRATELPALRAPQQKADRAARRFGKLLATLASAVGDRLTSPYRDLTPEYYRFPWF